MSRWTKAVYSEPNELEYPTERTCSHCRLDYENRARDRSSNPTSLDDIDSNEPLLNAVRHALMLKSKYQ